MKKNNRKTFYLVTLFALVAVAVAGFLMMPTNGTVSAQSKADREIATSEMIAISLNTRSAGNFAIFADKAVSDTGNSQIKGNVGVAGKDARVNLDSASVQGNTFVSPEDADRAQSDLAASFNAINQLPCVEVADSELGGKVFTPGVYCLSSANLAGSVTLDAKNDPGATFLFKVAGSFNTGVNSNVNLTNQASASNVVFFAGDSARIGKGSNIKGSIYAENSVKAENGSTVNGRILSLKGGVELDGASVVLADGTLEICKVVDPTTPGAAALTGRIFQFNITGVARTIEAPANGCSGPFTVPGAGNVVITEANTSRAIGSSTLVPGNFQLTGVAQRNRQAGAANALTGFNLPLRTANVTVPMGGVESQVTIEFTNRFAIVGFIEICKFGLDSDVTGFFTFNVAGLPQQTSLPADPLQQITVPVGGCAGPIAVTVPSNGIGNPRSGTATVTELARVGFFFVGANTTPADRLQNVTIVNNTSIAGIVSATIFEAGVSSNQTRFNFFNASNPAQVKICKVAGPGIAEGRLFNFTVSGFERTVAADGSSSATAVSRTFNVQAGPAAQGGFCRFVPDATGSVLSSQTFLVGTDVTVTENGPTANTTDPNDGDIRVSRITSSSGFTSPAIAGNVFFPPNGNRRTVVVPVRRSVVEVEYTNVVFRPGLLKICKIAGTGVAIGTPFTFDISTDLLQNTFPGSPNMATGSVTVQAGPAAQGGFCSLIGGTFTPSVQGVPTFNVGSLVTVTERAAAGMSTTGIRTTSGGALTGVSLAGGTGTVTILAGSISGGVFNPSTTEIEFVNSQTVIAPPTPPRATTAYDFDGDKKADISVFRDGNWYINRSELGFTTVPFGAKGDKLVSADYDGDHKADVAVYRVDANTGKGYFYILNSRSGIFLPVQFGLSSDVPVVGDYDGDGISDMAVYREGKNVGAESFIYYRPSGTPGADFTTIQLGVKGDIPVVGDYDGDGKTDAAVYRPSNGVWYMLQSRDGFKGVQFGISTDTPVAADYDGDGKTDLAVYRGGTWYLLQSTAGFTGVQFGIASDMPVPADVDGDGKDDIVVFRAGTWYWLNSGSNNSFQGMNFGIGSDVPVFCPASHQ